MDQNQIARQKQDSANAAQSSKSVEKPKQEQKGPHMFTRQLSKTFQLQDAQERKEKLGSFHNGQLRHRSHYATLINAVFLINYQVQTKSEVIINSTS